jgi:hypothetical protein
VWDTVPMSVDRGSPRAPMDNVHGWRFKGGRSFAVGSHGHCPPAIFVTAGPRCSARWDFVPSGHASEQRSCVDSVRDDCANCAFVWARKPPIADDVRGSTRRCGPVTHGRWDSVPSSHEGERRKTLADNVRGSTRKCGPVPPLSRETRGYPDMHTCRPGGRGSRRCR